MWATGTNMWALWSLYLWKDRRYAVGSITTSLDAETTDDWSRCWKSQRSSLSFRVSVTNRRILQKRDCSGLAVDIRPRVVCCVCQPFGTRSASNESLNLCEPWSVFFKTAFVLLEFLGSGGRLSPLSCLLDRPEDPRPFICCDDPLFSFFCWMPSSLSTSMVISLLFRFWQFSLLAVWIRSTYVSCLMFIFFHVLVSWISRRVESLVQAWLHSCFRVPHGLEYGTPLVCHYIVEFQSNWWCPMVRRSPS